MKSALNGLVPSLILLGFLLIGGDLLAGPPGGGGPGGQGGCIPPPCVPIDGGISVLIAAGVALGGKKISDQLKSKG
ncbi:MAG: hypothetical protein CL840_19930 [Crocinitomicaceae bacterium]|nr:hypothetical protein [Crocinitomicaceae bacterium]